MEAAMLADKWPLQKKKSKFRKVRNMCNPCVHHSGDQIKIHYSDQRRRCQQR